MKRLRGKKKVNSFVLGEIKKYLESGGKYAPEQYGDYILMTRLWHCTPEEFERQEESVIELHLAIYNAEKKKEWKDSKREEQMRKSKK